MSLPYCDEALKTALESAKELSREELELVLAAYSYLIGIVGGQLVGRMTLSQVRIPSCGDSETDEKFKQASSKFSRTMKANLKKSVEKRKDAN